MTGEHCNLPIGTSSTSDEGLGVVTPSFRKKGIFTPLTIGINR